VKQSAGTLLYREGLSGLEVLIVHPSGAYNRSAPWSLPKGQPDAGEDLEAAARRETLEETGVHAEGLLSLGSVELPKSRKRIFGFGGPAPEGAAPRAPRGKWTGPSSCPWARRARAFTPRRRLSWIGCWSCSRRKSHRALRPRAYSVRRCCRYE